MKMAKCPKCNKFGVKSKRHNRFGKRYYVYTCVFCGYEKIGKKVIK